MEFLSYYPIDFLIGQVLAMWSISSFHSPHLQQPHLVFEMPCIAHNSIAFATRALQCPAVARHSSGWEAECLSRDRKPSVACARSSSRYGMRASTSQTL